MNDPTTALPSPTPFSVTLPQIPLPSPPAPQYPVESPNDFNLRIQQRNNRARQAGQGGSP